MYFEISTTTVSKTAACHSCNPERTSFVMKLTWKRLNDIISFLLHSRLKQIMTQNKITVKSYKLLLERGLPAYTKNGKPINELFGDHDFTQDVLFKKPKFLDSRYKIIVVEPAFQKLFQLYTAPPFLYKCKVYTIILCTY